MSERRERSDDRIEERYLKLRMTPEEREEFVRKIGEDFKKIHEVSRAEETH
ncbi:MAG: hypothetical protein ACTSUO_04630 [Candidatus Thorarchaeota archaeon]